ncbi:uncharacterized protein LOC144174924 [Haemaphysalis longicornis]
MAQAEVSPGSALKLYEQHWSEKLPWLDVKRGCTATTTEDVCWLCDSLGAWNSVLNALHLHLLEEKPGKLCLCTVGGGRSVFDSEIPYDSHLSLQIAYNATFFTTWLPRKHQCVEAVKFTQFHPHVPLDGISHSIDECPSNLRSICINGLPELYDWSAVLDALGPVKELESLAVTALVLSAKLALKLAELLSANAASVTAITFSNVRLDQSAFDGLMSGISKCGRVEKLTLTFFLNPPWCKLPGCKLLAGMLRMTENLQELCLDFKEVSEGVLAAVASLLRKSTTLVDLSCHVCTHASMKNILAAIPNNTTLKRLVLVGYEFDTAYRNSLGTPLLTSLLSKNRGLRSLTFRACAIDFRTLDFIAEGLVQNDTLEYIDVSESDLCFLGVEALVYALDTNKTLRTLDIGYVESTLLERVVLTEHLIEQKLYGRVSLRWREVDTFGLRAALLEPAEWLTSVYLDRNEFCDESFTALCSALSSNCHVRDLTVHLWSTASPQVRDLLQQNQSLRTVKLIEGYSGSGITIEEAVGLGSNRSVEELSLACTEIGLESAQQLSQLLRSNQALRKVTVSCQYVPNPQCLAVVAEGLLQNLFITHFSLAQERGMDCSVPTMLTAVQRNATSLHRAVRFVLGKNRDKVCAEAFELLEFKPSLLSAVTSNSALTEAEAHSAAWSARRFIRHNYLHINRVVRERVECYPGEGTQIDRLNADCWLVIVEYLKVSDIVDKRRS